MDKRAFRKNSAGFTLMEIVVATTIFAVVATAMMSLLNYTLKINRRTETFRQATQGMRTFVEGFVKQIRDGRIYYGVDGSTEAGDISGVCPAGDLNDRYYSSKENKIRLINTEGEDMCIYLADNAGNYVGSNNFSGSKVVVEKNSSGVNLKQVLNPENFIIENMALFIRPVCDPYSDCDETNVYNPPGDPIRIQPVAALFLKFKISLPTGELLQMYYQTSISNNKYDIPGN